MSNLKHSQILILIVMNLFIKLFSIADLWIKRAVGNVLSLFLASGLILLNNLLNFVSPTFIHLAFMTPCIILRP